MHNAEVVIETQVSCLTDSDITFDYIISHISLPHNLQKAVWLHVHEDKILPKPSKLSHISFAEPLQSVIVLSPSSTNHDADK